jgi:hypothetical protein
MKNLYYNYIIVLYYNKSYYQLQVITFLSGAMLTKTASSMENSLTAAEVLFLQTLLKNLKAKNFWTSIDR